MRRGNFSLLWASTFTSQLGDHLNLMALAALIFSLAGDQARGFEFSKILLLASAPVLIFGPISGVYADRLSRKKMMIVSDLLRAGLVAAIPLLIHSMILVYVAVFLVFTINRFYLSARSAAMPQIVSDTELMGANSLLNAAMMVAIMLGPWGGGILVARFGFTFGFLADAGTYVVSAVLAAFIVFRSLSEIEAARVQAASARRRALGDSARHALRAASPAELGKEAAKVGREIAAPIEEEVERIGSTYRRLVGDLREGLATMKGSRPVLHATVSVSAMMFVAGFVLVVCPVLVRNEFSMGTSELGMLYSVAGVGMLIGSLVVGRFLHQAPRRAIISASFFVSGIAIAMLSVVRSIPSVGGWIFALGFFVAPTLVTCDTVLQESMDDMLAADVDGQPGSELVFGCADGFVYSSNPRTGARLWRFDAPGDVTDRPLAAQVNRDGADDVVVWDLEGIYLVDGRAGTAVPGLPVVDDVALVFGGDVNGDARLDLVTVTYKSARIEAWPTDIPCARGAVLGTGE